MTETELKPQCPSHYKGICRWLEQAQNHRSPEPEIEIAPSSARTGRCWTCGARLNQRQVQLDAVTALRSGVEQVRDEIRERRIGTGRWINWINDRTVVNITEAALTRLLDEPEPETEADDV